MAKNLKDFLATQIESNRMIHTTKKHAWKCLELLKGIDVNIEEGQHLETSPKPKTEVLVTRLEDPEVESEDSLGSSLNASKRTSRGPTTEAKHITPRGPTIRTESATRMEGPYTRSRREKRYRSCTRSGHDSAGTGTSTDFKQAVRDHEERFEEELEKEVRAERYKKSKHGEQVSEGKDEKKNGHE